VKGQFYAYGKMFMVIEKKCGTFERFVVLVRFEFVSFCVPWNEAFCD
jgi:hypothetical protein